MRNEWRSGLAALSAIGAMLLISCVLGSGQTGIRIARAGADDAKQQKPRPAASDTTQQRARRAANDDAGHHHGAAQQVDRAVAVLIATEESGASGVVYFTQKGESVEITGQVRGLTPGKHGFHVHEFGDITDIKTGESAGGHFNPTGSPHGRPDAEERHVGDLGNIEADDSGTAKISMKDTLIKLNGPHSILGRSVVVHAKADEFTQPSGDAGDRVAVGIIGVAQTPEKQPAQQKGGAPQR